MTAVTVDHDVQQVDVDARLDQLLDGFDPAHVDLPAFLGRQFDLGLAWVHFPVGSGGLGYSPSLQRVIEARLRAAGVARLPGSHAIGYGMGAPTVATHGSDAQRERYLRPLFTGEEIWCQLFSEPGAGSDLAGLATRAVRDGDEWVLNGQKVWTTVAHLSRFGMLLARTDASVPKHAGLTYFVLDMHAPGVEVRPLYQMTGEAEFNEVYLTDVRIPDAERLGGVGEGWRVALTTLMNERVALGGQAPAQGSGFIGEAVRIFRAYGVTDPVLRDELAKLWIRAEVLRLTNMRSRQKRAVGTPGPEGSIGKIMTAEIGQDISKLAVTLMGAEGMLMPGGYPMERSTNPTLWKNPQQALLRLRANSIEGGTTEIMRNILGERVLGLPPDVRVDKDVPWSEIPHS
jgi:alkylation response protein AidB-like acyl-CoA dehydrogenase